jgi:hypothetical protein
MEHVTGDLLGKITAVRCLGGDPAELRPSIVDPPHRGVVGPQHACQQDPLAAAVVDVAAIAMDAAVRELGLEALDRRRGHGSAGIDEEERCRAGDEAGVQVAPIEPLGEPPVADTALGDDLPDPGRGLLGQRAQWRREGVPARGGNQSGPDRGKGRGMAFAAVLLPPVVARLEPEFGEVADRDAGRLGERLNGAVVPAGVLVERPQPGPVAVQLERPPVLAGVLAVHRVAGVEEVALLDRLAGAAAPDQRLDLRLALGEDIGAPAEEAVGALAVAGPAHRLGDEGPVAEPREAVDGEAG